MTRTHATVSAVSYGKRTLLKMAFNVAEGTDDDDGNAAADPVKKLNPIQIKRIREELERIPGEGHEEALVKAYKVTSLEAINYNAYQDVLGKIASRAKRMNP